MRELRGKTVVITGGARGIGLALARRFARERAAVALGDLDEPGLEAAVRELREAGTTASGHRLDVTDEGSVGAFRSAVLAETNAVDVLVNNAGIVHGGAFGEVPLERHRKTLEVNVLGVVHATHAFLPDLLSRPEAHVVVVASASGLIALPWGTTYAASKWAAIGFADSLRRELEKTGNAHVRVTTVCPSYVSTGLFEGATPPRLSRLLTPERVADAAVRGVLRNRSAVLIPWLVRVTPFLRGILPRRLFEGISDLLGATESMKEWRGR